MDQPTLIDKLERTRIRHSHRHPPVTNVNQAHAEALTPGQRIADSFAVVMGVGPSSSCNRFCWGLWITANLIAWINH